MGLNHIFTKFASKILAVDSTELPEQQFAMIQDVLAKPMLQIHGKEAKELLTCLKRKHLVNSITVRKLDKGIVFSSSGNGQQESTDAVELLGFVKKNFNETDFVTLRSKKDWIMLMPFGENLYVVKANSSLSTIELRALAKEIETILKRKKLG